MDPISTIAPAHTNTIQLTTTALTNRAKIVMTHPLIRTTVNRQVVRICRIFAQSPTSFNTWRGNHRRILPLKGVSIRTCGDVRNQISIPCQDSNHWLGTWYVPGGAPRYKKALLDDMTHPVRSPELIVPPLPGFEPGISRLPVECSTA